MKGDSFGTPGVVPLRTILRNFLNLVENCEAKRIGGLDYYDKEFQELKLFSEGLKSDDEYLCKEGEKGVNRKKNRYKDILPFDYTRVILSDYGDVPGSDYINANFIKGASGSSAYIACQGPLPHTVNDFWRMVVECEVQVIVMACNEQESGKHKCENYWVEEDGSERQFGQVTVWLKKCRNVCPDFLVRTMRIRFSNSVGEMEERNVCQFHYSAWPDHGVPTKVRPLLDMVRLIRDCQTSETLPVLVHCSAGCGRTGTICAIDYVWGLLRLGKLTPTFSLFQLVKDMRRQRIAMVQTKDQYIMVHRAVRELFQEQLKIIDAHPYANVDENGLPLQIKDELQEPTYETIEYGKQDSTYKDVLKPEVGKNGVGELPKSVPSTSNPVQTLPNTSASVNAELEKKMEHQKKLPSPNKASLDGPDAIHSVPQSTSSGSTSIVNVDQSKIRKGDQSDASETKVPNHSASSTKTSLLRKPSIVKLKAFFEKSKDEKEKKTGTTQLSRAKSDVSSARFYSNENHSANTSSHGLHRETSSPTKQHSSHSDKPQTSSTSMARRYLGMYRNREKPALLAKPALPVKRSKSLKVHHVDSSDSNVGCTVASMREQRPSTSSLTSNSNNSSSSVSNDPSNPIKVCVKQVEMPKLQKVVSKSIKPEFQQAKTTGNSTFYSADTANPKIALASSPPPSFGVEQHKLVSHSDISSEKPQVPSRVHAEALKKNHNYANVVYGNNRIKMGLAKEMEDAHDAERSKITAENCKKFRKYDTVNPKSIASGRTSLTRSHSQLWQSDKVLRPLRIFSDENIQNAGKTRESKPYVGDFSNTAAYNNNNFGNTTKPRPVDLFFDSLFSKSSSNTPSASKLPTLVMNKGNNRLSPSSINAPVVRRPVPKTNPYTSFSAGMPYSSSMIDTANSKPLAPNDNSLDFHRKERIPHLKSNSGNSVGNSSDSSSNAGTPRNSLPSTPTQSIDLLYSQLSRNIGDRDGGDVNNSPVRPQIKTGGVINNIPPKSILKGSLSSTPSESDEKLDSTRPMFTNTPMVGLSNHTPTPKLNAARIAIGSRERRNSFRQAVWKEDEGSTTNTKFETSHQQYTPSIAYHPPPPPPPASTTNSAAVFNAKPKKTHKDYEPIWPESSNAKSSFRIGNNMVGVSDSESNKAAANNSSYKFTPLSYSSKYANSNGRLEQRSNQSDNQQQQLDSQNGPVMKNRVDAIKVLLEELKTPAAGNSSVEATTSSNHLRNRPIQLRSNSNVVLGTSLRHQRSLRVPPKPQYQQGLSCFTFKKPSSFESITDQLHMEEDKPLLQQPFRQNNISFNSSQNTSGGGDHASSTGFSQMIDRQGNDYVALGQCESTSKWNDDGSAAKPTLGYGISNASQNRTPVPPPRTKRYHQSNSSGKRDEEFDDYPSEESHPVPLSIWMGSQTGISTTGPVPSIVDKDSCIVKSELKNESGTTADIHAHTQDPSMNPTSPKAIIRALGLFQAKAANVRNRFTNWTEARERQQLKKSGSSGNGVLPHSSREPEDREQIVEPLSQMAPIARPSRSKHQYL